MSGSKHALSFFLVVLAILGVSEAVPSNELIERLSFLHFASYCGNTGITQTWDCFPCRQQSVRGFVLDGKFQDRPHVMFGYVGHIEDTIIAIFRGTVPISGVSWFVNNFRLWPVEYPSKNPERSTRVHKGFMEAYLSVRQPYLNALRDAQRNCPTCNKVIITGHSLGGAVASFAALDVLDTIQVRKEDVSLITSGGPRVGNMDFVRDVQDAVGETWRLVEENDIVPHVPSPFMGRVGLLSSSSTTYVHYPTEMWRHNGVYKVCSSTNGEDPTCSATVPLVSLSSLGDHVGFGGYVNPAMIQRMMKEERPENWCLTNVASTPGISGIFFAQSDETAELPSEMSDFIASALAEPLQQQPVQQQSQEQQKETSVAIFFISVGSVLVVVLVVVSIFFQRKFLGDDE